MRDRRRGFVEEVVEIESVPKMGLVSQKELCVDGVIVASSPKTVEWAGPIAPPQEPQS